MKRDIKKIAAGIMATLVVMSSNSITSFALDDYYYGTDEKTFIENLDTSLDTWGKVRAIAYYVAAKDDAKENCQVASNYMLNMCEAVGIHCSFRQSAREDSYVSQDHVNNVVDVDGTPYIVDTNVYPPVMTACKNYKRFYGGTGFSDGKYVYRIDSDGICSIDECLLWNASDITFPTETVNPLTRATVKITAIEQPEFVTKGTVRSVTIPDEIVTLRERAFYNLKSLEKVTLGAGITALPEDCFYGCEKLTTINLDNITSYGTSCLRYSGINSLKLNNNTSFSNAAFIYTTNLTNVTLPTNISTIVEDMFAGCTSLTSLTIPNTVTSIETAAFYQCTKLELTVPESVTSFGESCFENVKMVYCTSNSACAKYCEENGVKYKLTDVDPPNANDFEVTLSETSYTYSGSENKPVAKATYKGKKIYGRPATSSGDAYDFEYSYENNVEAGTAYVLVTGLNDYTGTKKVPFTIKPAALTSSSSRITFADGSGGSYEYTGSGIKPKINVIKDDNTVLTEGKDYTISYTNNVNAGTGTIKVTFMGNFTGSISRNFTINPAHQHTFGSWKITKQATCTTDGEQKRSCTSKDCGYYTETKTIPATGHSYKITSEADPCTGGEVTYTCTKCGASYTENVAAQGHKYVDTVVAPTCTTGGYTLHTCSVCGKSYKDNEIEPTGHKSVTDKAFPATCTTAGKTEGSHCSVCGTVIKAQTVIPAKGHTAVTDKGYPATCTASGLTDGSHCSVCGTVIKTQTTINATGHKSSGWITDKAASIGVKGSKHRECTVCKKVLETAEIPALSRISISSASVSLSTSTYAYDGKAKTPSVTVKVGGKTLKKDTDYTVSYSNNTKVGTAKVTITGKSNYTGTVSKTYSIKNNFTKATVSGISTKSYTGKNITQSVTVKFSGKALKNGTDYTISYSNNKSIGTATVKITGKGSYTGTITKTFKINPAKQEIQKLTAKSKAFFVDWAQKGSATGYEIQYATNSKFTSAKKVTITNNKTDTKTVSKLSGNKKYYVRVRSYTTVKGTKYYGVWSSTKTVTTKK